jgi:hypothetical protein
VVAGDRAEHGLRGHAGGGEQAGGPRPPRAAPDEHNGRDDGADGEQVDGQQPVDADGLGAVRRRLDGRADDPGDRERHRQPVT